MQFFVSVKNGEMKKCFLTVSTVGKAEICLPCMQTLWDFMEQTGARSLSGYPETAGT